MPPKIRRDDCDVTERERFDVFAGRGVFYRSFPAQANSHLEQMDAAALAAATDGFSDARLLGRGGFGAVYRGRLAGLDVAVKRLDAASMQGAAEFANEVRFLARATHRNLILLLGYETEGPCLVYELARGGSVEERLACANDTYAPLTWSLRLGVAIDVARGLNFLHAWPEGAIVHGDVKTANVLLTEPPLNPKACRERMVEIMFDVFEVKALYLCSTPQLALCAHGRSTGVVLDSGAHDTRISPVYEGNLLPHACVTVYDSGGASVSDFLLARLRAAGHDQFGTEGVGLEGLGEIAAVELVKREAAYAVLNHVSGSVPDKEVRVAPEEGEPFVISVAGDARCECVEQLFDPKKFGKRRTSSWGAGGMRLCI